MASTKSSAALSGAASGASTGAIIGSAFTPAGTVIGAVAGAAIGGILGLVVGEQVEEEQEAAFESQRQLTGAQARAVAEQRAQRLSLLQTGRRFSEGSGPASGLAPLAESNVQPITQSRGSTSSGTF